MQNPEPTKPESVTQPVPPESEDSSLAEITASLDQGAQSLSSHAVDLIKKLDLPTWAEPLVTGAFLLLCLVVFAYLLFFLVRPFVAKLVVKLIQKTSAQWSKSIGDFGIARWLSHFVAAFIINALIPGFFRDTPAIGKFIEMMAQTYLVISGLLVATAVLNSAKHISRTSPVVPGNIPVTSIVQILKLIAVVVALILLISTVAGKSPLVFLSGLGVFASVIMLVFKDAILGFVAGIQLTSNEMVKRGDWIEVPKHGADGDVLEVGLTTVKVLNFDKTITTIPTYALISDSFINWRSMPESGGRRIKRSIYIDVTTIKLCTPSMLEEYRKIDTITNYIETKQKEIAEWNARNGHNPELHIANGRSLTNLGTFRAYVEAYLQNHPQIHQESMTLMVRQLASGPNGVPIEVYCFTTTTVWKDYESIQADIFDHLLAVVSQFDLKAFQNPTSFLIESSTTV